MGEVVNLRMARKRAARAADAKRADANRARHGVSGAEKRRLAVEDGRSEAHLDGHRLSRDAVSGATRSDETAPSDPAKEPTER